MQETACKYGFPVTDYAAETYTKTGGAEKETIYKRGVGMERVVLYYPIVKAVYPAHGADMVMTSTVMAAYTGTSHTLALRGGDTSHTPERSLPMSTIASGNSVY